MKRAWCWVKLVVYIFPTGLLLCQGTRSEERETEAGSGMYMYLCVLLFVGLALFLSPRNDVAYVFVDFFIHSSFPLMLISLEVLLIHVGP